MRLVRLIDRVIIGGGERSRGREREVTFIGFFEFGGFGHFFECRRREMFSS